jgi:hypothetical protein
MTTSVISQTAFGTSICKDLRHFVFWDEWIFGLRPFSAILKKIKEHNVLEAGSVSILR